MGCLRGILAFCVLLLFIGMLPGLALAALIIIVFPLFFLFLFP
jgi:hypothetical protein